MMRGPVPRGGGGPPHQPPNGDAGKQGMGAAEGPQPPLPPPPPQFELKANSFPPLPGSDEPAPVVVEGPSEPVSCVWGDSHRFSDIMKGTTKPRPASQSSLGEREHLPDGPGSRSSSPVATPAGTSTAAPTVIPLPAAATTTTTTTTATQASQTTASTTTTTTTTTSSLTTTTQDTSSHSHHSTTPPVAASPSTPPPTAKPDTRPAPPRVTERRPVGAGGPRERRDFPREQRAPGRDHRAQREPALRAGKENRPLPLRAREDADGWITKGAKETRAQRESREQWEAAETSSTTRHYHHHHHQGPHNNHHHHHHHHASTSNTHHHHHHNTSNSHLQHLVNGDSSPPTSPKPQKADPKITPEDCNEEAKVAPSRPLNNNDGEHKTSWAKMALASKDHMERLAAELKEKEEQEKIKKQRLSTRTQPRLQEKVVLSREREGKVVRREGGLPREGRPAGDRGPTPFRPRDSARPKSPK